MKRNFTDTVMMIRPKNFGFNPDTAINNHFQKPSLELSQEDIQELAIKEFNNMAETLRINDIEVLIVEDTEYPPKYDAVFSNNWLSTHSEGSLTTYPLFSPNRRLERRVDILDLLTEKYGFDKRYGFEYLEENNQFLESTGSMVLDRINKVAFSCLGPRTNIQVMDKFAVLMGYMKIIFYAFDSNNRAIYHTNVMMALGDGFAILCLESVPNDTERSNIKSTLNKNGFEIIEIDMIQMEHFAGNMLQLTDKSGKNVTILSETALKSLNGYQLDAIGQYSKLLPINIPVIEGIGGGSVRCMLTEIFKPM